MSKDLSAQSKHDKNTDFLAGRLYHRHNYSLFSHSCCNHLPLTHIVPFPPIPLILENLCRLLCLPFSIGCFIDVGVPLVFFLFFTRLSRHFGKDGALWCLLYWRIVSCVSSQQSLGEFQKCEVVCRNAKQLGSSYAGSIHVRDISSGHHMAQASWFWHALFSLHCCFSFTLWQDCC